MGKEQATPARPPFALADAAGIACRERRVSADWNPFGRALDEVVASRWLLMVGVFDYGAVTAYLLRAYGPPNVAPLDPVKHSDAWALDTGDGYVIEDVRSRSHLRLPDSQRRAEVDGRAIGRMDGRVLPAHARAGCQRQRRGCDILRRSLRRSSIRVVKGLELEAPGPAKLDLVDGVSHGGYAD